MNPFVPQVGVDILVTLSRIARLSVEKNVSLHDVPVSLEHLHTKYGGAVAYLQHIGVDAREIEAIRGTFPIRCAIRQV